MPIVRPQRHWSVERRAQAPDEAVEDLLEPVAVGDVVVERGLTRLGDHLALLGDRRVVLEPGATLQLRREPWPRIVPPAACGDAAASSAERRRCRKPAAARPSSVRSRGPDRTASSRTASTPARASGRRSRGASRRPRPPSPRACLGPIPIEQRRPVSAFDLARDQPHRRVRRRQPGQLEVGLVEPDHLDRGHMRPYDPHHLARGLAVVGEVRGQEHAVGAQSPGSRGRHADPTPNRRAS